MTGADWFLIVVLVLSLAMNWWQGRLHRRLLVHHWDMVKGFTYVMDEATAQTLTTTAYIIQLEKQLGQKRGAA